MRRLAVAFTVALVVLAFAVGTAGATHSSGTGPKMDLVAGTATLVVPQPFPQAPQLHVNAKRDPETGDATGRFYIRYPASTPTGAFDMRGQVVCVSVLLNNATLVGQIERTSGVSPFVGGAGFVAGNLVEIRITDNGEPGVLDRANFGVGTPPGPNPPTCNAQAGDLPISQGNYIVHADPPAALLAILDALIHEFEAAAGFPFNN